MYRVEGMASVPARACVFVVAAGCIALVILLLAAREPAAAVTKLITSTAFLALAIQVGGLQSVYGRIVFVGLQFSWFGDAFLIGHTPAFFMLGLSAFLIAHLAYVAAFVVRGISVRWAALATFPIGALALGIAAWLGPQGPAELVIPVRFYIVAISLMVIAAIGTRGRGASALIPAGALMFFLSDLSVASLRLAETDFPTYTWGLPLYYAAQVCLALSTSQSRSH